MFEGSPPWHLLIRCDLGLDSCIRDTITGSRVPSEVFHWPGLDMRGCRVSEPEHHGSDCIGFVASTGTRYAQTSRGTRALCPSSDRRPGRSEQHLLGADCSLSSRLVARFYLLHPARSGSSPPIFPSRWRSKRLSRLVDHTPHYSRHSFTLRIAAENSKSSRIYRLEKDVPIPSQSESGRQDPD